MRKNHFLWKLIEIFAILLLVVFIACSSNKEKLNRDNKIKKISILLDGGWGDEFSISIDSSLNYFYKYSYMNLDTVGVCYGKVSQAFWDTLNMKIENIPPKQLDCNYKCRCVDCGMYKLLVKYQNKSLLAIVYEDDSLKDLTDIFNMIIDSRKKIKMTPCFEIISKRLPPPKPLVNELRVIPPDMDSAKRRNKKK